MSCDTLPLGAASNGEIYWVSSHIMVATALQSSLELF